MIVLGEKIDPNFRPFQYRSLALEWVEKLRWRRFLWDLRGIFAQHNCLIGIIGLIGLIGLIGIVWLIGKIVLIGNIILAKRNH